MSFTEINALSSAFYRGAVSNMTGYNSSNFDFSKESSSNECNCRTSLDATNPDLRAFEAHGGKLLQYHGWYDGFPSRLAPIQYYQAVTTMFGAVVKTQVFQAVYGIQRIIWWVTRGGLSGSSVPSCGHDDRVGGCTDDPVARSFALDAKTADATILCAMAKRCATDAGFKLANEGS